MPQKTAAIAQAIMQPEQFKDFLKAKELNFAISLPGMARFRVNAFFQRDSIGFVLRKIETSIPTLETLNLPPILHDFIMAPRGLVLIVGATGSGKSTAMASMIDHRNRNLSGHILTIEDPIEFVHRHQKSVVTQREVGVDTESYDTALKNALRQAPDVILIGEIRSADTMAAALSFSETGHLCLSTLHSTNTAQAIERIINFFPIERRDQLYMDLALNLRAIAALRLVPKKDGQGRVPASEILINTPTMASHLFRGEVEAIRDLLSRSTQMGMQTFDQCLYDLFRKGAVSYEDALRYADAPNDLRLKLKVESLGPQSDKPHFDIL
jgi:twitching motility protein PilU